MINIHKINNSKFKSIYFSINFTMESDKKEISQNSLLASILGKSCEKYKTQKEMQKKLYSLYGANFDIGIEKFGDLYNIEFRCECINKEFLPNKEDVVDNVLEFLYNMIFNPLVIDNSFDENIIKREKEFVINKIKEVKDDKLRYGIRKTEELMCQNEPFATYVYGDENEVSNITSFDLYKRYKNMLLNSCITFIISGNLIGYEDMNSRIEKIFKDKLNSSINFDKLIFDRRKPDHKYKEVSESQDTTQSVITYGLRVNDVNKNDFYALTLYNSILGGSPSSKLFQNFREKESLAYTVRSRYYRFKNIIIIYAGIQKENYIKAKKVIEEQIEAILTGNINDEEFDASKRSTIADLREWKDSKIALSKMFLSNMIVNKSSAESIEDMIEGISKVSKQDVINISKKIVIEKIFFLGGGINV